MGKNDKEPIVPSREQIIAMAWANENPNSKGLNPDGTYSPYPDPNGRGMDVGPGLLIGLAIGSKKFYTKKELDEVAYLIGLEGLKKIGKDYNDTYGSKAYPTPFDTVSIQPKLLMLDTRYQNGRLPLTTWKELYQGVADGNPIKYLTESRSKYTKDDDPTIHYDNERVVRRVNYLFPGRFNVTYKHDNIEKPKISKKLSGGFFEMMVPRLAGLLTRTKYGFLDRMQALLMYRGMSRTKPGVLNRVMNYLPFTSRNPSIYRALGITRARQNGYPISQDELRFVGQYSHGPHAGILDFNHMRPNKDGLLKFDVKDNMVFNGVYDNPYIKDSVFMAPGNYTRNSYEWFPRLFRMGFSTEPGNKLPRYMAAAARDAISAAPHGSFTSADSHYLTLPESIEEENGFLNKVLRFIRGPQSKEGPNKFGMSADATRFFTLQGLTPGHKVVYAGKTGEFNRYGTGLNKYIYDMQEAYKNGYMSADLFVEGYNKWADTFGGRHGYVDLSGKPVFYHPTVYTEKKGGTLKN